MHVLIIGGTGFIGSYVTRRLTATGHAVTLFNRGVTTSDIPVTVQRINGSREHITTFRDRFSLLNADVALDMRSMTERDALDTMVAIHGTVRRLVAISSQDVYRAYGRITGREPGPPEPVPLAEKSALRKRLYPYRSEPLRTNDDPERWLDEYDKILVERAVMGRAGPVGTILRLPMVYGPGDERQHRFREYIRRMDDHRPAIILSASMAAWQNSWGYVENVAEAISRAVTDDRAAGRIYNVAERHHPTTAMLIREIGDVAGWNGHIVSVPDDVLPPPLNTEQHFIVDSTRIRDEIGYTEIVDRETALRETVEWERTVRPSAIREPFDYAAEDNLLQRFHPDLTSGSTSFSDVR